MHVCISGAFYDMFTFNIGQTVGFYRAHLLYPHLATLTDLYFKVEVKIRNMLKESSLVFRAWSKTCTPVAVTARLQQITPRVRACPYIRTVQHPGTGSVLVADQWGQH